MNPDLTFEHLLHETRKFSPQFSSLCKDLNQYEESYHTSLDHPESFWLEQAKSLDWFQFPTIACRYKWNVHQNEVFHKWFEDGLINVAYNCLDRHLNTHRKTKTAILWQGENEQDTKSFTYEELHQEVSRCASALKKRGITKGDRVCLYMPMIPELAIAMLACARIGAIHSVIFGGFSSESLAHRIDDCGAKLLITANVGIRGGKEIPLIEMANEALKLSHSIQNVWIVKRNETHCPFQKGRDVWWHDIMASVASADCPPEELNAEDPLFILYTSGSTGKPKGVVHTQAGYLLHTSLSHKLIFNIQDSDIYWCTADLGWITGHSYSIYGPLANGTTIVLFEGTPTYPAPDRFWKLIEKYRVTKFYTAPTAIRTLIRHGDEYPNACDLSSLQLLGTVGEPINPEAWIWYYKIIGKERCPVVDTWWQTETGGIMISPIPGCHVLKPGSACRPFLGVLPIVLGEDGMPCHKDEGGYLCISRPWPGMMRTMWGNHELFIKTYFGRFGNVYFSGDSCRMDNDGDFWLLGRVDDVVNISGHRIGTAEVESALVSHTNVAEAAVIPVPHDIKGQGLYAYVILKDDVEVTPELINALKKHVKAEIGSIAVPDKILTVNALPKTRSGKIMRRILRKIAEKDYHNLGDTSTLADPHMLQELMEKDE